MISNAARLYPGLGHHTIISMPAIRRLCGWRSTVKPAAGARAPTSLAGPAAFQAPIRFGRRSR